MGDFDYIICHGVYSWVPDEVQDRILTISSTNLAPQGIAYISYNTYPGWHMREMIRDMMRFHANQFAGPRQAHRTGQGSDGFPGTFRSLEDRTFLRFAPAGRARSDRRLQRQLPFSRISRTGKRSGLLPSVCRKGATTRSSVSCRGRIHHHVLQQFSQRKLPRPSMQISQDLIRTEQYMDFVRNRMFRQTLLCHDELTLKRNLAPECLTGLLVASAAKPDGRTRQPAAGRTAGLSHSTRGIHLDGSPSHQGRVAGPEQDNGQEPWIWTLWLRKPSPF